MNYLRLGIAALSATAAYFILGGLLFGLIPQLRNEFRKYPAVYRKQEEINSIMPAGMVAIFLSILVLAVIYSMVYRGGPALAEGARFGVLVGIFAVGAFVVHNYVNLNIGLTLTIQQGLAYLLEWTVVGIVIGLIYRPAPTP